MASKINTEEGYDCDFVGKPDETLHCGICLSVAQNPRQHGKCGRLFCMECLKKYMKRKSSCPYCRQQGAKFFEDNRSNMQIKSLIVLCSNQKNGCSWEGELRELHIHTTSKCLFRKVSCPLGCSENILWINIDNHNQKECINRDYECPDCKAMGKYHQITTEHAPACLMALEKCPNEGCDAEISSALVNFHQLTECKYAVFECKYKDIGCEVSARRSDIIRHEKDDHTHIHLAMSKLREQDHYISLLIRNLVAVKGTTYPNVCSIKNFRFGKTDSQEVSFINNSNPYRFTAEFCFNKRDIDIFLYIDEGPFDDILEWPYSGIVTVELLNQQEDRDHFMVRIAFPADCGTKPIPHTTNENGCGMKPFITYKQLREKESQYLQNGTLYFRVKPEAKKFKSWLLSRPVF